MSTASYVIGIDAGGTKTVCQLADATGTLVSEARAGGANLQAVGELEVEKVLYHVMEAAIGDREIVPRAICLGIAGIDRPDDAAVVRSIMPRIWSISCSMVSAITVLPLGKVTSVMFRFPASRELVPQAHSSSANTNTRKGFATLEWYLIAHVF